MKANHPGHCPVCGQPIHVGDTIQLQEPLGWLHQQCAIPKHLRRELAEMETHIQAIKRQLG